MELVESKSSGRPTFKGQGRRKIEIKKIENKRRKWVTLSKRKKGLFKKAAHLSQLTGEDIAVLVISEQGRVYTSDNADSVFAQYLSARDGGGNEACQNQVSAEDIKDGGGEKQDQNWVSARAIKDGEGEKPDQHWGSVGAEGIVKYPSIKDGECEKPGENQHAGVGGIIKYPSIKDGGGEESSTEEAESDLKFQFDLNLLPEEQQFCVNKTPKS